ncbi:DNA polymerase III subunit delta [Acinetobacter qingfengensis]|uniref:DNA polymerase III subunit delta n=1 Tax=Acinetobacter qingfengensis TaxID=1262585 RepID=A0A1E7RE54_9GAMM|nr:DNA polymerase III subunit delta [Acinetobacter qingfengensis]KAA8734525.1 DNA polymerase III subunit delta [Acinetobacter qingfengensis]OEY97563.1 DNA polymerase III subunit delta [Acinetobacter qingfengensis]
MKLDYTQALKRVPDAQGVWLLHGAEPLLEQNLLQILRQDWQSKNIERQRFDLQSAQDWKQIFSALNSLSLFSSQLAIEVHGNLKPDAQGLKQLKSFIQNPQGNLLVVVFPKQESQSLKSAFFQSIEANGILVSLNAYGRQEQQRILMQEADKIEIRLDDDAWQWLLYHHENNLLAARNSLLNVADSCADSQHITSKDLQLALQDQSRYSTFDLGDACLKGDFMLAHKILNFLLQSGEAPTLIFWVLQKEMRLLLQLFEQPQNALQIGIWKNKIPVYQQALRRLTPQLLLQWPTLMLRTDCAIKGIGNQKVEDLFLQLIYSLCGATIPLQYA